MHYNTYTLQIKKTPIKHVQVMEIFVSGAKENINHKMKKNMENKTSFEGAYLDRFISNLIWKTSPLN